MFEPDLVRAAGGAIVEAAGTILRNDGLAEKGRMIQFRNLRRRQVRRARMTWSQRLPSPVDRIARGLRTPRTGPAPSTKR